MNALEIIGNYVEGEEFYELQLKAQEEERSGREIRNIRTEQIRTGEGIFTEGMKPMNADLAESLNQYPNPEKNGLVLYFAERLLDIVGKSEEKFLAILRFLYNLPQGWKAELPKKKPEGQEDFGNFDFGEYEQTRKFISETMVSGIKKFKEKHPSQDYIQFQDLSLNLLVAGREIMSLD